MLTMSDLGCQNADAVGLTQSSATLFDCVGPHELSVVNGN